jgi:hypothetical protein
VKPRLYSIEVVTPVVMKSTIFWDITPCSPLKVGRHFGEICRLDEQRTTRRYMPEDSTRQEPRLIYVNNE